MKTVSKKEWFIFSGIYLMLLIMYAVVSPKHGHGSDDYCWTIWSTFSRENGLGNVYKCGTDYLPLYHYILFVFGKWQKVSAEIAPNLYVLKNITLLFEMIIGFQLFRLKYLQTKNFEKALLYSLFYMLNICVLFNSVIWGQVDGIFSSLVFLSLLFAYQKRILLSLVMYIIAINFKLQAIVFLPLLGILLLPSLLKKSNIFILIKSLVAIVLVQTIILIPFIKAGTLQQLIDVVFGSFHRYTVLSMNAFNFWHLVHSGNLMEVSDTIVFSGLTFKNWGVLLFLICSGIVFFPILKHTYFVIFKKSKAVFPLQKIILIAALIPLLFFYCNTEMHERYSHPAFGYLAILAIIYKKPFAYILGSIAYFLNLEKALLYFQLHNYETVVFHPIFISILYLITIVYLIITLYKTKGEEAPLLPIYE
jgi:Gpi18-like mannosyltransferase